MKKAWLVFGLLLALPFSVSAQQSGQNIVYQQPVSAADMTGVYPFGHAVGSATTTTFVATATTTAKSASWVWSAADFTNASPYIALVQMPANITTCSVTIPPGTLVPGFNSLQGNFTGSDCTINAGSSYRFAMGNAAEATLVDESTLGNGLDMYLIVYTQEYFSGYFSIPTTFAFSTTSVAAYCQRTSSTTTGFLDSVASSISQGLCFAGAYLFVPNANTLAQFGELASTTRAKIPFSYYFDVKEVLDSQSASTTENFFTVSLDLPDIGSTTPMGNFIPTHIDFLSTTTISQYLSDSQRHTFLAWQRIFLVLGFGFMLYRRIIPHKVVV